MGKLDLLDKNGDYISAPKQLCIITKELLRKNGRVCPWSVLFNNLYGSRLDCDKPTNQKSVVKTQINKLRKILHDSGSKFHVYSHYGEGYSIKEHT